VDYGDAIMPWLVDFADADTRLVLRMARDNA
jgi:hypothetical protein